MTDGQRAYSRKRDQEDGIFILQAVLDFYGVVEGQELAERVIDKRELPPELEEFVGELERTLQKPVVCRIVKKP